MAAPVAHIQVPKRKPVVQTASQHNSPPDAPPPPSKDIEVTREEDFNQVGQEQERDHSVTDYDADQRAQTPTSDGSDERREPNNSHFSWTTYAPSVRHPSTSIRGSTDYRGSADMRTSSDFNRNDPMSSRFSWSTVATGMTRPSSPPPSPPPAVPEKYKQWQPPTQSILSRQRPVPRDDWMPPPPPHASGVSTPTPKLRSITLMSGTATSSTATLTPPTSARRAVTGSGKLALPSSSSFGKKLPLPPELASPRGTPMSHLEALLKQEEDIIHQRKNIERLIAEDAKIEKASPIEVSFAAVRDVRRRLEEHKATLAEVLLEEREIGIAISRARRRDGEEDALWVRRVTG